MISIQRLWSLHALVLGAWAVREEVVEDALQTDGGAVIGGDTANFSALESAGSAMQRFAGSLNSTFHATGESTVWRCDDYCVQCKAPGGEEWGIAWRIGRSQTTGKKVAKTVAGIGAAGLISLTGGLAGAVGGVIFGAALHFGAGAGLILAGSALSMGHLMINIEDRDCPVVEFQEKLPHNRGFFKGLGKGMASVFMKSDEQTLSLYDLNYHELLLQLKGPDGQATLKGDRQKMDGQKRLSSAIACDALAFDSKEWAKHADRHVAITKEEEQIQHHVVQSCAEWLCAGAGVQSSAKLSTFSSCGGRTNMVSNFFR